MAHLEIDKLPKPNHTIKTGKLHNTNCINFQPSLETIISDACWGKQDGEIAVQNISGGKSPYLLSLNDSTDFQTQHKFGFLPGGDYQIWVKDAEGCIALYTNEIEISERECKSDFSIRPNFGEKWDIPLRKINTNAQLLIFNKVGQVIYQLQIANGYPNQWDGNSQNGSALPMGSYSYILKYSDGKVAQGEVTLLR